TVRNTTDQDPGSLRAVLGQAQDGDVITFAIPGAGVQTIPLSSALPAVTHPVLLDATTQPGYAGTPVIELNGAAAGPAADGLTLAAADTTVKGLAINNFAGAGVVLQGAGGDTLVADFIGTDPTGTVARPNGREGVRVLSSGNTLGTLAVGLYNVISG